MGVEELPDPPPAPSIRRRVRLYSYQYVGLALLAAIPALAIAGAFGESDAFAEERTSELQVSLRYPVRYRFEQVSRIELRVLNTSGHLLDTVRVSLDSAYANRFSMVRSIPELSEPYAVELRSLEPGRQRIVVIELKADRYGHHRGELRVGASDTARFRLGTFIFP